MFSTLLRFEFNYQFRQYAFVGLSLIFLAFGLLLGSQGFATALVDFNAPYQISYNIGLTTIGCEFVIMFFAVSGLLRDRKHQMEAIVYSTAISKSHFFGSRFLGVFTPSLLAFSMGLIGFAVGTFMPNLDAERLAPFSFWSYIWTWLLFVLPNVFICTSILASVAILSKNNITTYITAVLIYFLYIFASMYFNSPLMARAVPASPEYMALAALADPFGLAAFFEQTQYWTPYQKNNQFLTFSGLFMWNRVLWVAFSLLLLASTYTLFSFKKRKQKAKKIKEIKEEIIKNKQYIPVQEITLNAKGQWASFKSLWKMDLINVFKSIPFVVVLLVWIFITAINIYERVHQGGVYNDSLYPTTNFLIKLTRDPILSLFLIVFYSGELVWKVRELNFNGIIDATPVSNCLFFLSKFTTLLLLPIVIITSSILICIGFQISKGYFLFEIGQYLASFYFSGMGFFFYILLALFVQILIHNKYLGMAITALFIGLLGTSMSSSIGIEHPMLKLGRFPLIDYTDMNGYTNTTPFHYFVIYWNALGFLLALLAFKLWQRGNLEKIGLRIGLTLTNWKRWERLALLGLGVLFLTAGSAIFYNTNVVTEYKTASEQLDFKEAYERKYKRYEDLERLTLMEVKTKMDIFPRQEKYQVKVDYVLENRENTAIQQVLMTERMPLQSAILENATLIEYDSIFDTRLYKFKTSLLPNEQVKFTFELVEEVKGFESSKSIVKNGSYIAQHSFKPTLGYRKSLEIKDNFEREKRGMSKRIEEEITDNHLHNHNNYNAVPIYFETTISTNKDQIAIAPGDLINQWTADGRNHFHYKSTERIMESITYFSADYQTKTKNHKGISIEQYYHEGHEYNLEKAEENTKLALDYCSQNFGKYPFDHIRIAEIPAHWGFGGQAMPGNISMVADRFYLLDNRNPEGFDLVAKRTIHEVAHQWWGMLLRPKIIEGGSLLIEGFAKYTEAVIMEQKFGKAAIWQLSESANQHYFSGRSFASEVEPPLYYSDGENYLSYGKSYVVMLALKELIGEEKVNQVLSSLVAKHRNDLECTATSIEFIEMLYEVSPSNYHVLIDDWLKRILTYDLKITDAEVKKISNGEYEVSVSIAAQRFEIQADGSILEISINEPIQLGVFTKAPKNVDSETAILHLQAHQITNGTMEFKIIVEELPSHIAIDPFGTRLDANRVDNIQAL